MVMISIPILTARKSQPGEGGVSQRTEYYTTAKVQYTCYRGTGSELGLAFRNGA